MGKIKKRKLDIAIISDVHLGTFGCNATALINYLKTIQPKTLILNGDIIDIWQFNKRYFPKSHMKVIKYITSQLTKGTKIYYVTGNHDEMLRKFEGFKLGSLEIVNKLVLDLDGKKTWIFHGDVFDVTMKHSKWLAKLGGKGYDLLILINTFINWVSNLLGFGKISLSKKIKNSVKTAVKFINNFEIVAAEIAVENNYQNVICGHIHQPEKRVIKTKKGEVLYLNSGDWVENLTALEYHKKSWNLYRYEEDDVAQNLHLQIEVKDVEEIESIPTKNILFDTLLQELEIGKNNHRL